MSTFEKKDDDTGKLPLTPPEESPFTNLDKGIVLQEKRVFNETPLKVKESKTVLTKIMYLLLTQGDKFTTTEATDSFFSITRLFQNNDVIPSLLVVFRLASVGQCTWSLRN